MKRNYKSVLQEINNPYVTRRVEESIELCQPAKVTILTGHPEDVNFIRELALKNREESKLNIEGHTIHFDGYYDQGRDKTITRYLLSQKVDWGIDINSIGKEEGLDEIRAYLRGSMAGKEMLVCFYSLGPTDSPFSIPALQITDSAYVVHSEDILYRSNFQGFKNINGRAEFFFFLHSAGRLQNNVSANVSKKRIYIDIEDNSVYSVNNQYAGNSVGLKKLAFRLAIRKAHQEGWLAEHMFIMGVHGKGNRTTYFSGAFPSACGKTSTAMLPEQTIVGDDIAYLKKVDGEIRAANVEKGIFGIITDVNEHDDPEIFSALTTPRELIFSNVLIKDGTPYWLGKGQEIPEEGFNHSGKWYQGKKDTEGNIIDPSHKNARYTIDLSELDNVDSEINNPNGVPIDGFLYGGRDSDTTLPIVESLNWQHGVFLGATLESETTFAILGQQGVRKHDPMAILDFISIPFVDYIKNYLSFTTGLNRIPNIYATNYFLKDEKGNFLNGKKDKKVWVIWAEGRVHGEFKALETPIGRIPLFEDLQYLFQRELGQDYTQEDYIAQFTLRVDNYLAKMARMEAIFAKNELPAALKEELKEQTARLNKAKEAFPGAGISPLSFYDKQTQNSKREVNPRIR